MHPLLFGEHIFTLSGGGRFSRLTGTPPGAIAQLVEQRTENPCVTGSIPVGTTKRDFFGSLFLFFIHFLSYLFAYMQKKQ